MLPAKPPAPAGRELKGDLIPLPRSVLIGSETRRARVAEMKCLVLKIRGLHLNREVVHTKPIVQLRAQLSQQVRLRDARSMNDVRAQRFASRRDCPNMQIVYVRHASRV